MVRNPYIYILQEVESIKQELESIAFGSVDEETNSFLEPSGKNCDKSDLKDKMEQRISLNVSQEEPDTQVEEVDLTSSIAYVWS